MADENGGQAAQELKAQLLERLGNHDSAGAVADAVGAVTSKSISIEDLYLDVLSPIMTETGRRWQTGQTAVWEEHLISATVRQIVDALALEVANIKKSAADNERSVLLACPTEEQHDLGLRMMADLFEISGWHSYFLGADTPDDEIVAAARQLEVTAVVLSAATHFHCLHLRTLVGRLNRELPDTKLWVTGAAFERDCQEWAHDLLLNPTETMLIARQDHRA